MQHIPYLTRRSAFVEPVRAVIRAAGGVEYGRPLAMAFDAPAPGYAGTLEVVISPTDPHEFETTWTGADPTRFPARIRAAATALRDEGCCGRFRVAHDSGRLRVERL